MNSRSAPDGPGRGELESLFDLFLENREALREYFRRLTLRHPEWRGQTDDVLDEALLCVVRVLEREAEARATGESGRTEHILGGRFGAYFRQIVRNLMIDIWRTIKRHRTTSHPMSGGSTEAAVLQLASEEPDPSEVLECREEIEKVQKEVLGLPPSDREVVLLWMLGVPYEQMAQLRQSTRGAVCSQKKRALHLLRDRLHSSAPVDGASRPRGHPSQP
ncbi:MAG: sigma-70 family RNA polymerase sigma factor [Planctomycetota bacterium]